MIYTEAQYEILARIEPGTFWPLFTQEELITVHYLDREGLLQPREDLQADYLTLSEHGKRVLADYRTRQEQFRKETEKETSEKRQQRFENKLSVANLFVSLISFVIGILLEYFGGIAEKAISAILSLFR